MSRQAPNGTKLFPELALRCFELERILKPERCSSTIAAWPKEGGEEKAYGENSPMRIHSQILHVWDYLPTLAEKWLHSR